jgi:cobalt-zinc-cadmium resistance protein CzcA
MRFLSAIVGWSVNNRIIILMLTGLFMLLGLRAATQLPIDAVPDVTNVQVQVITTAPALSPVEVEQYVTVPVERAMSGLPRSTEVRSVSKYGLSVVTVVFEDSTNIYFARQLVAERMREAEEAVPSRYGRPEMGPISSGLGEIYQFVMRGEGHSLMELEETLDWYVAPQLRMVPGIVEVNSFGGENKQYQVVLDAHRLQASGISVQDVVDALQRNNANAGGGYIERHREQLVIGTEGLVRNLDDLRSVVLGASVNGAPITVSTVGDVRYGPSLRRGASSMDAQGEVVVGVALMLLGGNSRVVTEAVKTKLAEVQTTLPQGMRIEPFYDRAALVNRTIKTVAQNLVEGAALVIGVLFFLLGDLRAGLIVASVIPLAMAFAIILMNALGISGNLMSLGAVDFGLIVDGAVIIVENAARRLHLFAVEKHRLPTAAEQMTVVHDAALEVRQASLFGEAIIAIVYLPILALQGIEGKLFHPMAVTVLLALLGAFITSLTVVPALASKFLRAAPVEHHTWIMRQATRVYEPIFARALRHPRWVLGAGLVLLVGSLILFTRLGAEFVPQLDEGDILLEVRRLPGIALSESIATDRRIQAALKNEVPEVAHVVSRTGAPELATDPMGMEQTDVYIQLTPRNRWRAGLTKEALGQEIAELLEERVPEAAVAVSQPIQMRTNELIAGVRSDVAAQIYGPDLNVLQKYAEKAGKALERIAGVDNVRVEQGSGLSYLRIRPDRVRLARYGLTIDDVNTLAETLAVGKKAGTVFEGDRRFDVMVKSQEGATGEVTAMLALPLRARDGQVVPLGDVANIVIEEGPAVVNRDRQSRRRMVEFNVRGRDLLSTVSDAQAAVAAQVALPAGYRVEWGGQFHNFISARQRLMFVVPTALLFILFMLWLAFHAVTPALLIFLNVPFAVIGGILALWLRGMPFSISAGIGFIALFGVAVLNGLVLMSFCRHQEGEGVAPAEAMARAAKLRLRPVLTTAVVAALGFLPMALSTAPGSEVQRPLATVVIGGLMSATVLTLLLFPVAYVLVSKLRPHNPMTLIQQ